MCLRKRLGTARRRRQGHCGTSRYIIRNSKTLDHELEQRRMQAMCTSPQIPLREKFFLRMIYENTTRPREVPESRIELWNRNTGEITFPIPKSKYNRRTRRHIPGAPRAMKQIGNTIEMFRHYVGNRKKGHIFMNSRAGKRLILRHFEKIIDKWARLLNIQKQSIKPKPTTYTQHLSDPHKKISGIC